MIVVETPPRTVYYDLNIALSANFDHWDIITSAIARVEGWCKKRVLFRLADSTHPATLFFGVTSRPIWGEFQDDHEVDGATIWLGAKWLRPMTMSGIGFEQRQRNVVEHELVAHVLDLGHRRLDFTSVLHTRPGWWPWELRLPASDQRRLLEGLP